MTVPNFAREPRLLPKTRWLSVLNWYMHGGAPEPPLYLRTTHGTFYLVHTVRRCRPGSKTIYRFGATRIVADEVPPGATIHGWYWTPRRPKRRA